MSSVPSAPAPAAIPQPTGQGFDELLGGTGEPNPSAPTSAWDATAPAPDGAETDARRPFGDGVERDDAVDPSDSIFGTSAIPVSVNTQGIAVAAEPVSLESRPILVQPGQPLEAPEDGAISLHPPLVVPAEPVGSEPAPLEQRVGRSVRLFWVWFAVNSSIAAVIFGAIIFALGVNLRQAIVATLAGVALSFIPLGLGTLVGKRSGQPTMVVSRATFGVVGNILPVLIALVSRLFWAGALLWILGAGAADLLVGARLTDGFTRDQLTAVSIAVGFIVAVVIAYFGYALIVVFQLVVTIVSSVVIIGFVALTYQYVDLGTALATPDGPWILVVTGAVMVFSFVGLAWANGSSDVARYQRVDSSGAGAMLSATFGAAIPTFVLVGYGALLAASNASLAANIAADPLDSLGRLLPVWYPAPLIAGTVLSLLAGVTISLYSGGFALQATGLRLRRSLSTILIGVLALVVALVLAVSLTSLSELFRDFATTVAVPVAAWAGIFGAEVMLRKRRFDSPSLLRRGGVYADARWGNLLALVVIAVIGFGFTTATVPWLSWEGYLFGAIGVPLSSQLAASDVGVLVALLLGIVFPLVAGIPGVRKQEKAIRRVG
ncbi:MAG: cytosine permease [Galbitalea sp.]